MRLCNGRYCPGSQRVAQEARLNPIILQTTLRLGQHEQHSGGSTRGLALGNCWAHLAVVLAAGSPGSEQAGFVVYLNGSAVLRGTTAREAQAGKHMKAILGGATACRSSTDHSAANCLEQVPQTGMLVSEAAAWSKALTLAELQWLAGQGPCGLVPVTDQQNSTGVHLSCLEDAARGPACLYKDPSVLGVWALVNATTAQSDALKQGPSATQMVQDLSGHGRHGLWSKHARGSLSLMAIGSARSKGSHLAALAALACQAGAAGAAADAEVGVAAGASGAAAAAGVVLSPGASGLSGAAQSLWASAVHQARARRLAVIRNGCEKSFEAIIALAVALTLCAAVIVLLGLQVRPCMHGSACDTMLRLVAWT